MVISYGPVTRSEPVTLRRLRELAAAGTLAAAASDDGLERTALAGAAYELVWPIVFARVTRRFERQRGHAVCASGLTRLADECLDRFHDDVEAVVDDLLTHARRPIRHLEAWVTARLGAATVNAHRRRRGERGALQRPRLPGWLADGLGRDRWLMALATDMLVWVGVSGTAGDRLWPVESWAQSRGAHTGDWQGSDPATVQREIDTVLAAMRVRPAWFQSFVERPLGAKRPPVVTIAVDPYGEPVLPLVPGDPDARVESELHDLAGDAVRVMAARLGRGEKPETVVGEVLHTVFGGAFTGTLDQMPHSVADPLGGIIGALTDRSRVDRVVAEILAIVGEGADG
ncbi:hypothetical protein [Actinoplanes sp. NPDC049802]|uniref:hypothetical protein n=1 Tax=Actinoplanes sp. NPDC049802 TaxID=3154742 RepID=UPI003400C9DD